MARRGQRLKQLPHERDPAMVTVTSRSNLIEVRAGRNGEPVPIESVPAGRTCGLSAANNSLAAHVEDVDVDRLPRVEVQAERDLVTRWIRHGAEEPGWDAGASG